MNQGLRGDGDAKDVDGHFPPQDGRVAGDDDDDDFPLREGSFSGGIAPPEGKSAPAQVSPRDSALRPKSPLLIFSRSK